jgi:hypothetical protein
MYSLAKWDVEGVQPNRLYAPSELSAARELIQVEAEAMKKADGVNLELDEKMWQVINNCSNELVRHKGQRFVRLQSLKKGEQLDALDEQYKVFLFLHIKFNRINYNNT